MVFLGWTYELILNFFTDGQTIAVSVRNKHQRCSDYGHRNYKCIYLSHTNSLFELVLEAPICILGTSASLLLYMQI